MAGDDDHRLRLRGQRLLGGDPHQRLAADLGEQLVRPAHAGRAAGGEDDRGDAAVVLGRGSSRGCGRVTISISSPPTPMPVMSSRATGSRRAAASAPSRSRFPSASARSPARRAPARRRALPISSRLPGSTGMPKCSIAPPSALDRRRDDVAPVGDGGGAEHDHQLGAVARAVPRSPSASAACSCGTRRSAMIAAPAGASRSAVTCSVLSTTFGASPAAASRRRRPS